MAGTVQQDFPDRELTLQERGNPMTVCVQESLWERVCQRQGGFRKRETEV